MKKKFVLLSLLAALVFNGCSSDDPENEGNNNHNEYGYVAVNIVYPQSVGGRAGGESGTTSSGFEAGTSDENKAETGLFFIFDAAGEPIATPQRKHLESKTGTSSSPAIEKKYDAVLAIDGATIKPTEAYIVCVLNAPTGMDNRLIGANFNKVTAEIGTYDAHTAGTFIMSNSVYKGSDIGGTAPTYLATKATDNNITTSEEDAISSPVNIYVERVVTKVRATTSASFQNKGATLDVKGKETTTNTTGKTTFKINITGIEVANVAQTAYLFKHIENDTDLWPTWNDMANKRCYWETVPTGLEFTNKSYNAIVNESPKETGKAFDINYLKNHKFQAYIQPNTGTPITSILVTAELKEGDKTNDLIYLRGEYYTVEKAQEALLERLTLEGFYKKTGTSYVKLKPDDFKWYWRNKEDDRSLTNLKNYESVAYVIRNNGITIVQKGEGDNNASNASDSDINKLLQSNDYKARYYKEGKCYYFVNIEQTPITGQETTKYYGVVRNHIYDLTLNSIEGPGVPIFDTNDIIIPETPTGDTLYYLSASVNVLQWKIVTQEVNFK